jgi:hypothetical protein
MLKNNFKEELQEKFKVQTAKLVKSDLEKMFLNYMCSDEAEDSLDRQSATISYKILKKILDSID